MASGQSQGKGPTDPREATTERRPGAAPDAEAQQGVTDSGAAENLRAATAAEATAAGADTAPISLPTGLDSLTNTATRNPRKPRPGACSYLMFDIHDMKPQAQNGTLNKLMAEIKLVSNTADYHVSIEGGFLIVLGTAERATNSLLALATSIKTIDPNSKLFIGSADVSYANGEMVINNLPMGETRLAWGAKPAGMYITEEMDGLIKDPSKSREGSHFEIETSDADDLNLRQIESYKAKVGKDIGGPDEMVGYENEGDDLNFHLRDDDTKLIILKGQAGIGKSRLLNEQLAKLPSYILCSLDAADKNVPGASLITLAAQLAQIIEDDPILRSEEGEAASAKVVSFSRLPLSEKRKLAERNPAQLADMCSSALSIINFAKGQKTPLVIEDLHHADRHSEKYLLEIAKRYLESTDGTAKVVFSMRPEEMYESDAQRNLEKSIGEFYGEDSTHEVSLSGLEFSDPKISEKYCFHSLPKVLRQGKTLGTWHEELGKRAGKSPLIMTTLMATLLENPSNFVVTDDGVINVKPQALAIFDHIEPDDPSGLAGLYHQRIAALDEGSRAVLQAVALAGGKISSAQISAVIKKFAGGSLVTFAAVTTKLVEGGYVKETDGSITLQHEMIAPFVISSITDPERKTMMANLLYGIVGNDPETPNSSKFAMLHHIAGAKDAPGQNESFWDEYAKIAGLCLDDAQSHNAYGSAYSIARAILDPETGATAIKAILRLLTGTSISGLKRENAEIPENLEKFVTKTLLTLAKSGLYLGRFNEVKNTIKQFRTIRENQTRDLQAQSDQITLIEFEAAYVRAANDLEVKAEMAKIYAEQIQSNKNMPVSQKAAAGIRFFLRQHKIPSAEKMYDEHIDTLQRESEQYAETHDGMPLPELADIERLIQVTGPLNFLRKKILNIDAHTKLDEDCQYYPEALTPEQKAELANIKAAHAKVKAQKEKFPGLYNPYSELGILDAEFKIASYEGDYETAFKCAREAMRIADQMDLGNEFGRHVNDLAILNFTTGNPKEAFKVLTREGKLVKSRLEKENVFQFLMRAQAVIAAGMICRNQADQTPKAEMTAYIQEALKLFAEINEQFASLAKEPDVTYGIMGYISPILAKARELGIPLPQDIDNPEVYPFMQPAVVASGIAYAAKVSDKGIRGVAKEKRQGMYELLEGLLKIRDSKLKN